MKKKIFSLLILLGVCFTLTGCKSDKMEDIDIYTTVYPIEYITSILYGDFSNIHSIYPDGVNVNDYKLTSKQIKDYSDSSLLIFNGLNSEKDYVTKFFKENKKIKIIDATQSMEYDYRTEELWLNPSNFLMIAQNIKNGFNEYLTNQYIMNQVSSKYEELKINISKLDATFTTTIENANYKTIIVTDDAFNFLTKYGFNIVSLDKDTANDKAYATAKELLNSGESTTIFDLTNDEISDRVQAILDDTNASITHIHNLSNITEKERSDKETYISIMNNNIDLLKKELYR